MIIQGYLPPIGEYYQDGSYVGEGIRFIDRECDRFRIIIPEVALWDSSWTIAIQEGKGKSESAVYLQRVTFKCVAQNPDPPAFSIIREKYKAHLAHSYQTEFFYSFPLGGLIWLSYSVEKT